MSPLTLAYLALVSALASGIVALGADRYPGLLRYGSSILLGACGLLAIVAGGWALLDETPHLDQLALGLPWLQWHLRLDVLSGFFFSVVGLLVLAVSFYAPGYLQDYTHAKIRELAALGFFTGLFILGMLLVLLADDAFVFMIAWELMSVSSYFLVAYQHQHAANRRAAFLYLLMAHVGGLAILLGFGVIAGFGNGFTFEAMRAANLSVTWASIAFALVFFGFGMKAGMVPVHAWLPEAHPVAPSHISALMSGVMLKVAIYGFIRFTFDLLGNIQWQWGLTVLVIGAASTLLGVLYALMQHDLKRLLAYHSVENIGIILMGIGLSMIFISAGRPELGALGLIAALYHSLNHALFKGLLFLGAGAVLHATHEHDLNNMGGLIKRLPQTAMFFLIGCLAISGLPPLNGFVSEWLTFQAALQAPSLDSGVLRSLIPIAAALLALSAALAAACFVKVYGVAFLGTARSRKVAHAREVDVGMRAGMGLLAALALIFLIGLLMRAWLFRQLIKLGESILLKIPLIKVVYRSLKDLFGLFSDEKSSEALQVVTVQIPGTDMRLFGFLTRTDFSDMPKGVGNEDEVAVYLPMSYQVGGYTVMMPRNRVTPVPMSREEAMRFVLTAGLKTEAKQIELVKP